MSKKQTSKIKLNISLRDYVNQVDEEVVFTCEASSDEEALKIAKEELETDAKKIVSSCLAG